MTDLAPYAVYTMRQSRMLEQQAQASGPFSLTEGKPWATAHRLLREARQADQRMPLIFSGAEADTGLIYWALIDDIRLNDTTGQTTCEYSAVTAIGSKRKLSDLVLRSANRPMSEDNIRPYAICLTPPWLP